MLCSTPRVSESYNPLRTSPFTDYLLLSQYYDPTGRPPFYRAYVNFMKKHCHSWTYNTVRVQEEESTVCEHHCIFYLIHRCAGHSMTYLTRLLENLVEATTTVRQCFFMKFT
jgi:hypothetical protein